MPITQVFDPVTGAANGGGGGGGSTPPSLYEVELTEIDLTDPSWTLYDPDGLIKTVAFSGGYNTITFNELAVGSSDYNWAAGSTIRAPRWYKDYEVDGNRINTMDFSVFTSVIGPDFTVGTNWNPAIAVGHSQNAASTSVTDQKLAGGYYSRALAGNPTFGTVQHNSATTSANTNNGYGACTTFSGGQWRGSGVYLNADEANDRGYGGGSRNSNQQASGAPDVTPINLHFFVGVGIRGNTNTIPQDAQVRAKLYHIAYVPKILGLI
jgi:hypothetical protein